MTRVFVIGIGPLLEPTVTFFTAQALRTWHLATAIRDQGHEVILTVLQVEGNAYKNPNLPPLIPAEKTGFPYVMVNAADPADIVRIVQAHLDSHPCDCIVAINLNAAHIACRLKSTLPLWADLYGHLMGEAQSKCARFQNDDFLAHFWNRERLVLRRADFLSTTSFRQMYATLGELGAVGRLNQFTSTHSFVDVMPAAASPDFLDVPNMRTEFRYRGKQFPPDAFAVLWSGGFNTWSDPLALAGALSLAMEQNRHIYFIATGGAIAGHDELTYQSFLTEMERTGFRDRCLLLGWVEARELPALYRECDLGINMDALNYETLFGARTRLTNMMAAGLPVLTTLGTEISEIIAEFKLGYTVKVGDVQGYADAIVRAAQHPSERRAFAKKARQFVIDHFSENAVARPLLKWVEKPSRAPDNEEKVRRFSHISSPLDATLNPLELEAKVLEDIGMEQMLAAHRDLHLLRQKPLFRLYKFARRVLGLGNQS